MLYPFKFHNIYKEKIWGGHKINNNFIPSAPSDIKLGEVWLLSGVEDEESVVSNGYLEENTLNELAEVYMGDLTGDKVYDRFNSEFPVLVKIIDAAETLSVQVHPSDELAKKRHNAYGKSELWYVLDADKDAFIYLGFKKKITKEQFVKAVQENNVDSLLNKIPVKKDDIYFIPSGTVHTIGAGVVLAEVQQTSDITYRIYDWGRVDKDGELRELHTDLALDAITFDATVPKNLGVKIVDFNEPVDVLKTDVFNVAVRDVKDVCSVNLSGRDSFTALLCIEGKCEVEYDIDGFESLNRGEVVLLPLEIEEVNIYGNCRLLEIYI